MVEDNTSLEVDQYLRDLATNATPGSRLPSIRELTARYHVSPVTVSRVLNQLVVEGVVTTRPGAGTFAADVALKARGVEYDYSWQTRSLGSHSIDDRLKRLLSDTARPGTLSLASGYPHPSLTASRQLTAALLRAARRPGVWDRAPAAGTPELRRWFAAGIGPQFGEDDVLITSGGQSALSATLRALVPPGGSFLVESPTYPGALAIARAAGLNPIPIPVDEDGLRSGLTAEAFATTGARVVYCQPGLHNPTGSIMPTERRAELMHIARAVGAFIVEDDWARWLGHATSLPPPMLADDVDGRVVHIRSLTKTAAPSLRIGAVIARGPVAERLRSLRFIDDFFVPRILQETAAEFLNSAQWQRHLAALGLALRTRRGEMIDALARHAVSVSMGPSRGSGLYIWVRLPEAIDDLDVADAAERAGVRVSPGRSYFVTEPTTNSLRLSFAATAHPGEMDESVRRLASVLGQP
jgi:DNA-binding transcriptional MocR family regulator